MKKNKMMRLASFLLVAVLLSTCAISGTFAKYTSTKTNSDTARVAKWSFKVDDKDIATENFAFNLFDVVADTNQAGEMNDEYVADGVIAPGTWGYFDLKLTNASEVNATVAIAFGVTNTNKIPVQFKVEQIATGTAAPTAAPATGWTAEPTAVVAGADNLVYGTGTITYRVYWQWTIDGNTTNDGTLKTDTELGIQQAAGTATELTVSATITATQVD